MANVGHSSPLDEVLSGQVRIRLQKTETGRVMPEVRFEAKAETVAVLDGYCSAAGKCRTTFINQLLDDWAASKLHESMIVCLVAGVNPTATEDARK